MERFGFHSSFLASTLALFFMIYLQYSTSCKDSGLQLFNYSNGPNGPSHWGDLNETWRLCKVGMNQSPINISSLEAINDDSLGRLRTNYSHNQPFLASLGPFNVALNFGPDAGGIMVNSTEYILNQYHTHIPSEHILNGTRFPLEIHLVHRTSDGSRIAVISLPYTYGKRDHIFEQVLDMISSLKEKGGGTLGSSLNMTDLKISGKAYYRYSGSLTTPPCTEGVVWTVLKEPRTISPEQLSRYRIAFTENNARFTQELNGRPILYHG